MAKIFNAIIVAILIYCVKCSEASVCINEDPCLCQIDEFHKIDLSPIGKSTEVDKDFLEDGDSRDYNFFFHGCTDGAFNLSTHNVNVSSNATDKTIKGSLIYTFFNSTGNTTYRTYAVRNSKDIKFVQDEKHSYEIIYKIGDNVNGSIKLVCVEDDFSSIKFFHSNSDQDKTNPSLVLYSPYSCVIKHQPGLSTGSVLLIIFFISLGVYFIGGAAVLYCIRGARGLELIPHIDFWRSLPGLVKDGVIFLFSGCSASSITTPETYDRI